MAGVTFDGCSRETGHATQLHGQRASVGAGFHGSNERKFAGRASAPLARALATEIGIIDLDPAGQASIIAALEHDLQDVVLELPGRVGAHAQIAR